MSSLGHLPDDTADIRTKKSFLVYLAVFMSGGGVLWGSISLANGLVFQSLIPYAYTVVSVFNLWYFHRSKDFGTVRFIQILISLLLPFFFQWVLGGFFSSGMIMLWALLALVASPSFQSPKSSVVWLILFLFLTVVSAVFQDYFYSLKPDILPDQSLLFITLNASVICAIVFGLVIYFVHQNNVAQEENQVANASLQEKQTQVLHQKDVLHDAIVETNDIIERALKTGDFNVRMQVDGKDGEWQSLAISINKLFDAIVTPLSVVRDIAGGMIEGDLTRRFEAQANGQMLMLKSSLNQSLDQISDLLLQIRHRANVIGQSSETMQTASQDMSNGTVEINGAIGEISMGAADQLAKVDEASTLISTIADSAKSIDTQAQSINEKAAQGASRSEEAIDKVKELTFEVGKNYEFSNTLLENCRILTEEAKSISSFTGLIREIAAQTNMLSLNAGIQAADAGEHGHGFAVVAEEIRQLAERAKGSVQEIDNLITDIQDRISDTQDTVVIMNGSIGENRNTSMKLLGDFTELLEGLQLVLTESKTISDATSQQNTDLGEIVKLTANIVTIAEETATSSRQVASSTNSLTSGMEQFIAQNTDLLSIARDLQEKTEKFTLQQETIASVPS